MALRNGQRAMRSISALEDDDLLTMPEVAPEATPGRKAGPVSPECTEEHAR